MIASLPLGVFVVIVLFFVAMAAIAVVAGVSPRKQAAIVKATPTSPIGMAADGYREFEGTVEAVPGAPVTAPLTGWPCVGYHATEVAGASSYRYNEERIYAGDPLLVLGDYQTHTFDPADDEENGDAGAAAPTSQEVAC